jgi:hypothetical protein
MEVETRVPFYIISWNPWLIPRGTPRKNVAVLHAVTGGVLNSNPGANKPVPDIVNLHSVACATGEFTKIKGVARNDLAAANPSTVQDLGAMYSAGISRQLRTRPA